MAGRQVRRKEPHAEDRELLPSGATVSDVVAVYGACTLDKAALHLSVSRERIRQIEGKAIKKLAKRLRLAGLSLADMLPAARGPGIAEQLEEAHQPWA